MTMVELGLSRVMKVLISLLTLLMFYKESELNSSKI